MSGGNPRIQFRTDSPRFRELTFLHRQTRFQFRRIPEFLQFRQLLECGIFLSGKLFRLLLRFRQTVFQGFGKLVVDFRRQLIPFRCRAVQLVPEFRIIRRNFAERFFQFAELFGNGVIRLGKIIALFNIDHQILFEFGNLRIQNFRLFIQFRPFRAQFFQVSAELAVFFAQCLGIRFNFFRQFIRRKPSGAQFPQFRR